MATRYHLSISVRGILRWSNKEWKRNISIFTDDEGRPMTIDAVKKELLDHTQLGHTRLPGTTCDNFDYIKGCLGHPCED